MTQYTSHGAVRRLLAATLLGVTSLLAATPAAAGPFMFGGASFAGGGERSEYVGVSDNLLPVSFLTQKFVVSDYHYKYDSNGTTVSVNGQSAEAAIGVKKAGKADGRRQQSGHGIATTGCHQRGPTIVMTAANGVWH